MKVEDLTGQPFGRLTVKERAENDSEGRAQWLCECACGNTKVVKGTQLRKGSVVSCGCYKKDINKKHGLIDHPMYATWKKMRQRCTNPNNDRAHRYIDRGITVCDEWMNSFEAFYNDMSPTWQPGLTLDRIDNDGNYCKENCRWATPKEQGANRSTNTFLTYKGERKIVSEWAREYELPPNILWNRVFRLGWDIETALTKKPRSLRKRA
jgi:hypothetical protein